MARKTRSDSKIDKLPPETRQELIDLFVHENVSLGMAQAWLATHDVSVAQSSLWSWHKRVVLPLKKEMLKQRAIAANALVSEARGEEIDWNSAVEIEVAQQAYELLTNGSSRKVALDYARTTLNAEAESEKLRIAQTKLKQNASKIKLDERRLRVLEEQHASAQQAKAKLEEVAAKGADGGLTEETLEKIEMAIGLL